MISLGFIGFGEAGYNLAAGLREEGIGQMYAMDVVLLGDTDSPAYQTAAHRVAATDVQVCESIRQLAEKTTTVILAVPAQVTEAVGKELIEALDSDTLVVDVTTASPQVKGRLGALCQEKGILYVDSPMLGPLIVDRHRVPILACGPGAVRWRDQMLPYNMNIELIEGEPGSATQIKLARSIFTKGFEALLVETFLYARRCNIESLVMKSIGKTLDGKSFEQSALRYMASNLTHAARKAHEIEDAAEIMDNAGVRPMVAKGAASRLQHIAALDCSAQAAGKKPETLEDICRIGEACGALQPG